jgi:hypothetical protein
VGRVFLDDDAGGPGGHRRAGEDAHGLAGADGAGEDMARRRHADHAEAVAGAGGVDQRVAIHRGGGKGGWSREAWAGWIIDAAGGAGQGHGFFDRGGGQRQDAGQRLFNRNHRCASYRPDFPPSFETRWMSVRVMDFSTALTMS